MRILVCGSRFWTDEKIIAVVLDGLDWSGSDGDPETVIIEGQCPVGDGGADRIAERWAKEHRVGHLPFPGEWRNGRFQGPERNQRMVDEGRPEIAVAFKDGFRHDIPDDVIIGDAYTVRRPSGGTEDCIRRAKAAGVPSYVISHG